MVQIFGGHRGNVVLPFWFRIVRGAQIILALIVLGLAGYGISVDEAQVLRPALILALITAIFTVLPIILLTFPLGGSRGILHPVGSLALDSLGMIFWLASLTAIASYTRICSGVRHYGEGSYFGYYYNASSIATAWRCGVAAAVFAAFELLLFLTTLLFFAYSYHHYVAGTQPAGPLFRTSGFGTASVTKDEEHAMTDMAPTSPSTAHAVPHGISATGNGGPSAAATNPPYPTGSAYEVPRPPLPTGPARDSAVSPLHVGHQAPPPQLPPVQTLQQQDFVRVEPQLQPEPEPAVRSPKAKGRYVYQPIYVPPEHLSRCDSKTNIQALPSQPPSFSCHGYAPNMEGSARVHVESTSNMTIPTATPDMSSNPTIAIHPPIPTTPDETTSNGGDHFPSGFISDMSPHRQVAQTPQQPCLRPSLVPAHQQPQTGPPSILYQQQHHQQQRSSTMPRMPNHARSLTFSPYSFPPKNHHHPRTLSITHPLAPQPLSRSASPNNSSSQYLSPFPSRPGMPLRSLSAQSSPTTSTRPKSHSPSNTIPYAPLEHPLSPKPPGQQQQQQQQQPSPSGSDSRNDRVALAQRRKTSVSSVATVARFASVDERNEATGLPRAPPGVDFEVSGALAVSVSREKKTKKEKGPESEGVGKWGVELEGVPRGVEWMVCWP